MAEMTKVFVYGEDDEDGEEEGVGSRMKQVYK